MFFFVEGRGRDFEEGQESAKTERGFSFWELKNSKSRPHLGLHELPHRFDSDKEPLPRVAELGEASRARTSRRRGAAGAEQWDRGILLVFVFRPTSSPAAAAASGFAEGIRHDDRWSSVCSGESGHFSVKQRERAPRARAPKSDGSDFDETKEIRREKKGEKTLLEKSLPLLPSCSAR